MSVIEPLLEKAVNTGEYAVNFSLVYILGQIAALVLYSGFIFILNNKGKDSLKNQCTQILENYVLNENQFLSYNRSLLKDFTVEEICNEKNELKKIAIISDREKIKSVVDIIANEKSVGQENGK